MGGYLWGGGWMRVRNDVTLSTAITAQRTACPPPIELGDKAFRPSPPRPPPPPHNVLISWGGTQMMVRLERRRWCWRALSRLLGPGCSKSLIWITMIQILKSLDFGTQDHVIYHTYILVFPKQNWIRLLWSRYKFNKSKQIWITSVLNRTTYSNVGC